MSRRPSARPQAPVGRPQTRASAPPSARRPAGSAARPPVPAPAPAPAVEVRGLPRAAALLVGLEGVLLVAIGLILLGYALAGHRPADAVSFGFVVGFSLLTGVGLLAAGRGLLHRRHMARAPAVLTQLFCIPVGANMLHSVPYAGIPLIVLGVVGLVLLFAPATTHALGD